MTNDVESWTLSPENSESNQEDEDSYLEEPRLKYERLSSDLDAIFKTDSVSAFSSHSKFILIGTNGGMLHMLDALGNSLPSRQYNSHGSRINAVSIDHIGEYIASCSCDGKIVISGLYTTDNAYNFNLGKEALSVSIDPIYAKSGSGRRFMTGCGDKVILYEKSLFNRYRQIVLSENEGPIPLIKWRGRFAAWCSRKGVRVYDIVNGQAISLIKAVNPYDRLKIPTRITWIDQMNLIVCLGDTVRVCLIKKRFAGSETSMTSVGQSQLPLPEQLVEINHTFTFDKLWVLGAAPLENNLLVLLTIPKNDEEKRPSLIIVEPVSFSEYILISSDVLSLKNFTDYEPKDYRMEFSPVDYQYLIVSPKDVILGRLRDQDDHVDFLIENGRFNEALEHAEENEKILRRHTALNIGQIYMERLLSEEKFEAAGALCVRILGRDKKLWQEEISKFAKLNQLKVIAPVLPTDKSYLRLDSHVYETILLEFLKTDVSGFLDLIRKWSPQMYDVTIIVNAVVEELLARPENETLLRSLATLFTYQRKYDKAMAMYLKLGHPDVFSLIRTHNLEGSIADKIESLLDLDRDEAISLFVDNIDILTPDKVVSKLGYNKDLLRYLDAIRDKPSSRNFHGRLLQLYADFENDKLLPFLKFSDHYPIQQALEICELRGLVRERIYILARMGNTRKALQLITMELSDIHQAVNFCKSHDDPDLWKDLIDFSLDKPYFINILLHNIGTHVDPRILIMKIENGKQIPGLRDSLVQIMLDYRLQVSLQEGCKRILVADCYSLLNRHFKLRSRGVAVRRDARCGVCNFPIIQTNPPTNDVIVFMCHHSYHVNCVSDTNVCLLCHSNETHQKNVIKRDS